MQKNILIIEDEKSIRNILKAFLEDAGYQITLFKKRLGVFAE
ncbi:hypothetical protein ABXS75_03470 [Roseburia hominis]